VCSVGPRLAHEVAIPVAVSVDIDAYLHARLDAGSTICERDAGLTEFGERRRRDRTVEGCLVLAGARVGSIRRVKANASVDVVNPAGCTSVRLVPALRVQVGRGRAGCDRRAHLGGERRRSAVHGTVPVVDETGRSRAVRVVRQCAVLAVVAGGTDVTVVLLEAALGLDRQRSCRVLLREVDGCVIDERLVATGLPGSALGLVRVQRHITRVEALLERDRHGGQVRILGPGQ